MSSTIVGVISETIHRKLFTKMEVLPYPFSLILMSDIYPESEYGSYDTEMDQEIVFDHEEPSIDDWKESVMDFVLNNIPSFDLPSIPPTITQSGLERSRVITLCGRDVYVCPHEGCTRTHKSIDKLRCHLLSHNTLSYCGLCMKDVDLISSHVIEHSNEVIGCNKCDKFFVTRNPSFKHRQSPLDIRKHKRNCEGENHLRKYTCICGSISTSRERFKDHKSMCPRVNSNNGKIHTCECGSEYIVERAFLKHKIRCENATYKKEFRCVCGMMFRTRKGLTNHKGSCRTSINWKRVVTK